MTLQKNTHSTRVELEKAGIGMLAGGTYVASKFNADAVKAATAVDKATLKWEGARVWVAVGNKGRLARHCEVSKCGKFVRFASGAILHVDTISHELHAIADFGAALLKKAEFRAIKRANGSKEALEGYAYGSLGDIYSGLAYALNGNVILADVETRSNEYNSKVLCTLGDAAAVAKKAETLALELQKAIGAKAGKKVKAERAAVRAKRAGAKAGAKAVADAKEGGAK